ncbi:MAG: WD40 repeat domain-containing serine/threonine-protein kinase [Verrucomicrobiales bacterium]
MADSAGSKRHCRTCDRLIPSFAPGGHCPSCLLRGSEELSRPAQWEDRFTIIRELGEGGFGRVYLAEQHEPVRRKVALKIIKPGMGTREVIARFEVERQALAALDHPNIATIYDAGETADGHPAIAMEYVPGLPITDFAGEHNLGLRERLELFVKVCQGVHHAHLHGIIHRDLKPSNLLTYSGTDGDRLVRIIDFGIAKATRQGMNDATLVTLQHRPLGTPAYMSPEQAEGWRDVDARTDVYSLGALLYEILTNTPPLERKKGSEESTWDSLLKQIREESPCMPSKRLARTPMSPDSNWGPRELAGDLDWIALTALAKDRQRRYQSVDAFREDICAYLEGRPVVARSPGLVYRSGKWIGRHRVASAAILATVVALLAGTIVSTVLAIRAERARGRAETLERNAELGRKESQRGFSQADYQQGCRLLADNEFEAGIAHLCRALRTDPSNSAAANRLAATLAYTNFLPPLVPEALHPSRVIDVYFRNEAEFVTVSEGGVAGLWSRESGERLGDWLDHGGEHILSSSISTNKQRLVTTTAERGVRVWDLDDRRLLLQLTSEATTGLPMVAVFSGSDAIVTGSSKGSVCKWDIDDRTLLWQQNYGHPVEWLDAAGDQLIAVSGASAAYVLNSVDGVRRSYHFQHGREVMRARFSPDGKRLLTASLDGIARVWNVATGEPVTPPMVHDLSLYDATWAPGGVRVATAAYDATARVWWAATGKPVTPGLRHGDHVYSAIMPIGGRLLATGGRDQKLRLWDAATGQLIAAPVTHERSVSTIDLDSLRQQVLVGGRHEQVRLLDIRQRSALPVRFRSPGKVSFSQIQEGGRVMRTLYRKDGGFVIERRETDTGAILGEPLQLGAVPALDAAKKNDRLVVKHDNRRVSIYADSSGALLVPTFSFYTDIKHIEIDASGRFVFICGTAGKAVLLTLDERAENQYGLVSEVLEPFPGRPVDDVIMLGDPLYIAARLGDQVRIYSVGGKSWLPEGIMHEGGIGSWDFHPGQGIVITGGYHDTAKIWDMHTGMLKHPDFAHADVESGLAVKVLFSPDGRLAVTSSWHELAARVWNTETGILVANPLYQNAHIDSLAIDPTSRYLAATSDDKTMRIWNIEDGYEAIPVQQIEAGLARGRFLPDGTGFLAVQGNETLLWPLPAFTESAPDWVINFAESLVGRRLDSNGVLLRLPDTPVHQLRSQLPESESWFEAWFKWIAADPSERAPSVHGVSY